MVARGNPGRTPKMADIHWRDFVAKIFEATPNYWYDGMIDGGKIRHYHEQMRTDSSTVNQKWCGLLGAWAVDCCWTELGVMLGLFNDKCDRKSVPGSHTSRSSSTGTVSRMWPRSTL